MKIEWAPKSRLIQLYGKGPEMALASADGKQIGSSWYCKDYANEILWGSLNKKPFSVYGFAYDPKTMPLASFDRARVLFMNADDDDLPSKHEMMFDFMRQVDTAMNMDGTIRYEVCEDPPDEYEKCGVTYWEADGRWASASPLISMFLLMLRNSFLHNGGNFRDTINRLLKGASRYSDVRQLESTMKVFDFLCTNNPFGTLKENYNPLTPPSHVHSFGGIVSYANHKVNPYYDINKSLKVTWEYPS